VTLDFGFLALRYRQIARLRGGRFIRLSVAALDHLRGRLMVVIPAQAGIQWPQFLLVP
jgi:hypothetical protein